ncbi:alpha/beta hydrolase [Sphingomonas sp. MG17]|uniref:Alpha/beta hydrolase n=1 Tax=Sphingomonas tagetis TaxID=2949092 RepID=A0A9X2HSK4_9SPHN|nr:alpha/beta hydrolase [Sphingomonas tagetis]MCP3731130.1 alpha/beta hydrolase [Sphingomonas tagetis]
MLDRDIAALLGEPAPMPALTPEIIPMMRAGMAAAGQALTGPELANIRDLDADGVPVRLYLPEGEGPLPLLVFLHGGGWMFGDLETHDAMHRHLAARTGCAVLGVGYRLAPEHCFPAGLDDAATAFAWARREAQALGCDPDRIALGGESAGGNFTAAITLKLREVGEPQPLFQLLVHPATDLAFQMPSFDEVEAPGLSRDYLDSGVAMYAGKADVADPLISPLRADRHDALAPAIVLTAAEDPLRDDGEYYAAALARAGVETLVSRLPGLPHGFMFLPVELPAVSRAFDLIARLLRRYFAAA